MESLAPIISISFGIAVPLAIMLGRYAIKRQRQDFLVDMMNAVNTVTSRDVRTVLAFEVAFQKYDLDSSGSGRDHFREFMFSLTTAVIFMTVSCAGFYILVGRVPSDVSEVARFGLAGIPGASSTVDSRQYALETLAVIGFSFLGAYVWSIQYLIRRVANVDLTPMSFLRVTSQILLAGAIVVVLRHITPNAPGVWPGLAFLIGFFPTAGLEYLLKMFPKFRTKRLDPNALDASRAMPVDMLDGIDAQVSFRLAEREIVDVENLACENPILLCAETPYSLLQVIDWIAQAQLAVEFGPVTYRRLRDIGVRTVFSFDAVAEGSGMGTAVLGIINDLSNTQPRDLKGVRDALRANLHVSRLFEIGDFVREISRSQGLPPAEGSGSVVPFTPTAVEATDRPLTAKASISP